MCWLMAFMLTRLCIVSSSAVDSAVRLRSVSEWNVERLGSGCGLVRFHSNSDFLANMFRCCAGAGGC